MRSFSLSLPPGGRRRKFRRDCRTCIPVFQTRPSSRHRLDWGFLSSSVFAVITQPFRQYPHWNVCSSMNAV